ncbi:MAG: heme o synthase [Fimbriimonadaceae bacterium]
MASDSDRRAGIDSRSENGLGIGVLDIRRNRFAVASIALLFLTVVVILFGAFVRASLSGDGCGTGWPMCENSFVPVGAQLKTYIEASHRISTEILWLIVGGFLIWAYRLFEKGHPARKATLGAFVFTTISGLIGAILVIFKLVTHDTSLARAITMPMHLLNTFALMAALCLMVYFAKGGRVVGFGGHGGLGSAFKWTMGSFFALGMTGAISAMGKTAYATKLASANTFMERVQMHVGSDASPLLKGGLLHPLMAMAAGLVLLFTCRLAMDQRAGNAEVETWSRRTIWLYLGQMAFGTMNLVASAPIWMQLTHLALALANWIALVMLAVYAMPRQLDESRAKAEERVMVSNRDLIKAYVALTKPRIISLLLFTTVAAMFIGAKGVPPFSLILIVMIGGYMSAGAANTINMLVEKDLDVAMERTASRPTITHVITDRAASIFAAILTIGSTALLWFGAHPLAAIMALCGLLCYVFVYTLWLKRRTWHNIVIGGAAGAFPPLVGYAAVTGNLSAYAWFLFALIFTWTPVHFWALAILIKDDYAKAGVPMLPVVKGDRVTVMQIGLYAVITVLLCIVPLVQGEAGWIYAVGAGLLNLGLLVQCAGLWRNFDKDKARSVFKYSMVYLALIFVVIAVDRVWTI